MCSRKTVFSQLMGFLPTYEFKKCIDRYAGHYKVKSFTCWDQFLCMAFAQLTYRESLRDIEACLRAAQSKLYHSGFRSKVSRNTLAHANETRDWRIYADFAQVIIQQARDLYIDDDFGVELDHTAYALDATVIDLCLSLFPWARFRRRKGGIKLHTLMDLRGSIPSVIHITRAQIHEVNIVDRLIFEPGALYIMDRGYMDFSRLYRIHQSSAFFLIRAKRNMQYTRLYSHPVDRSEGLRCDQTVRLTGVRSRNDYPEKLRRIRFYDDQNDQKIVLLSNNSSLSAQTLADLYRCRWKVELFFKWIKQHLRIKAFYGLSENAVKTQIWIAITIYVLVAVVKKRLDLEASLYTILQIFSITLFEKMPIERLFSQTELQKLEDEFSKQLSLFD